MSRTDLDAATLARSLRRMAGDGGMEWCCEPIQANVLLDVADMLDENVKLRELVRDYERCTMHAGCSRCEYDGKLSVHCPFSPCFPDTDELYELGVEVDDG